MVCNCSKIEIYHTNRAHTLYYTVDDSSDVLESGPTRKKKRDNSAFFLIFSSDIALNLPAKHVICK